MVQNSESPGNGEGSIIKTSEQGWLKELALAYKTETNVILVDDAKVGVDPVNQTLFQMGRIAKLSTREMVAVCTALGMSAAGIAMIILAFVDPEPTSKLWLLVGGGVVLIATGGGAAIKILTQHKPPTIHVGVDGFEIKWE